MSLQTPARPNSPPSQTPITDFSLIESQKENIRPLPTGRSASTLNTIFTPGNSSTQQQEEKERYFRDLIESAELSDRQGEERNEDILEIYLKYILFLQQYHPSSTSYTLPIIESITRRFLNDGRFKQDVRYLKLWIMYIRLVERREEIWSFLNSKEIGTNHSVFYEEWAGACESLGRKKAADDIYRLGIARRASPLERLKSRHAAFLERISIQPHDVVPDDDPPPRVARAVLGQVTSTSGTTQLAPSLRQRPNGTKMEVFTDTGRVDDGEAPEWAEIGTREGRRKENTIEAGPWKGETLIQGIGRRGPRTPKVEVFKDSQDNNDALVATEDIFSRTKPSLTEAELLRSDPLKNFDTTGLSSSSAIPILPPPQSARKPPRPKHFVKSPWECPTGGGEVKDAKGKMERRMFDWDSVFKNGEEWSFEEVRAREKGLLGKETGEVRGWERVWHLPGATSPKEEKKKSLPSPTVNTKLAELEVMRMFDQTIHAGKLRNADSDSDSDSESDDEDPIDSAPTPLPTRGAMSMLVPLNGLVPPTPTPAQGHVTQSRGFTEMNDENAGRNVLLNRVVTDLNDENTGKNVKNIFKEDGPKKISVLSDNPKSLVLSETVKPSIFSDILKPQVHSDDDKPSVFSDNQFRPPHQTPKTNIFAEPIFNDENAVPSTSKKLNIFSDPIPDVQTQTSRPSQTPKSFGVFSDLPTETTRPSNIFSTPAPALGSRPIRRPLANAIVEADEGEEEEDGHDAEQAIQSEDEETAPRGLKRFEYRSVMTPIYERTAEFTLRSSQIASSGLGESVLRSSQNGTSVMGQMNEAFVASTSDPNWGVGGSDEVVDQRVGIDPTGRKIDRQKDGLPVQEDFVHGEHSEEEGYEDGLIPLEDLSKDEEDEQSSISRGLVGKMSSTQFFDQDSIGGSDEDTKLGLPEGFTIQMADEIHTLAIVDRSASETQLEEPIESTRMVHAPVETTPPQELPSDEVGEAVRTADVVRSEAIHGSRSLNPNVEEAALETPTMFIPNPCDPTSDQVISILLNRLDTPPSSFPGFHDHRPTCINKLDVLRKHAKSKLRRASTSSRHSISDEGIPLTLSGKSYEVIDKIGEGGFGSVFLSIDLAIRQAIDDISDTSSNCSNEEEEEDYFVAIKIEKPSSLWEFIILNRIRQRLSSTSLNSLILPRSLHLYSDESYLILDYSSQGTLLDIVNRSSQLGISPISVSQGIDELLVVFFTISLLRIMEDLHKAGIIHCDIKIDNCLISLKEIPKSEGGHSNWSAQFNSDGKQGWKYKGLKLIDFGRSIDITLFEKDQKYLSGWDVDEKDCLEMRQGKSWSFEPDYFGVLGIVYCLLFGKYIPAEAIGEEDGRWKLMTPLKRYWQQTLWTSLFDSLLNPHSFGKLPMTSRLTEVRKEMESWLEENCQKGGKSLRGMLKKIELEGMKGKRV
ncbi:BUB protein kinase [Tremella mesenterica]|uniref:BUB protein kinase n=1 Tax=Tremella mesenterica TaxID=5217 RepID=A0A4Q1BAQ1_TREME|nr:BUB protein kinase [Tremella mesenterica]